MRLDCNAPWCYARGSRCGSDCGHGSGFVACWVRASSFGCDCHGGDHCDAQGIGSPWRASDVAKRISTWFWSANRRIASDCATVSRGEIWRGKAFSGLIRKGTVEAPGGCCCEEC